MAYPGSGWRFWPLATVFSLSAVANWLLSMGPTVMGHARQERRQVQTSRHHLLRRHCATKAANSGVAS